MQAMHRYGVVCLAVAFALLLGLATNAAAQSQASTGQIAGTVKDSSGAVIPSATVEAFNAATGFKQKTTTGADGFYRMVLLPAGKYQVTATASGFASSTGQAEAGVGRTTDLNFSLGVAGHKEEVMVTAQMIEAQRHEAASFMNATVVSNIPLNGGRFHDIAILTPAAQVDPQRGQISLTGQRMVNTGSLNVDGMNYGQLFFGGIKGGERSGFAPTIPLQSIEEFQIVQAGYTAEFGQSTGGVLTAITKSGTNNFHGSAGYYIRPDSVAKTNEYYTTVKNGLAATCPTCTVNPNPTLMNWDGAIGGPVKKDKFFFFGSYNQQRQRIPHTVFFNQLVGLTPTASTQEAFNLYKSLENPYGQTNDAWMFLIKGDYVINQRHRLNVRYNQSNYEGKNATSVGAGIGVTLTNALSNNGTELDSTRTVVGQLTSFFSHFANEFRGQYARETRPRNANAQLPTVSTSVGTYGTVNFLGQNREYDYRIQFADGLTWIKGAHTAKFGGEYSHLFATQTFGFNQNGAFSFSGVSLDPSGFPTPTLCYMGATAAGTVCPGASGTGTITLNGRFDSPTARYLKQLGNLQATLVGEQIAAFVHDSWRVLPNFTINYGLRWEAALNPTAVANNSLYPLVNGVTFPIGLTEDPAIIPNQTAQFAPRLGFAWDPFKDNKTVIRGFGGIYFATTPLLLYAGPSNTYRDPPGDLSTQLPISTSGLGSTIVPGCPSNSTGNCNTIYKQLLIVGIDLNAFTLDKLPIVTADQVKAIANAINTARGLPFNPFGGSSSAFSVENHYHNPRSYQAGFGIEREIQKGWTVGLDWIWIKTVYLERNRDLNVPFSPCTDLVGRPLYRLTGAAPAGNNCPANLQSSSQLLARPISSLGQVQIRDFSAKALYRSLTFRTTVQGKRAQLNASYTISENLSNDDNERDAGGPGYMDSFNFAPDYGLSRLHRRHQFVATPVVFLPWGLEVSSGIRVLSGAPINATLGSDANQDGVSSGDAADRPYSAVSVPFKRNSFHNRALTFIDLRVQKAIPIKESKQVKLSVAFFNLFNRMNLTYSGSQVTNFCTSAIQTCGIATFQGAATNGWTPNPTFLQIRNPATGPLLTNNNAGSPMQVQFAAHFVF